MKPTYDAVKQTHSNQTKEISQMRESTQLKLLKTIHPDVVAAKSPTSPFDALCHTDRIIYELKSRRKTYPTTRLERQKLLGMKKINVEHPDIVLKYVVYDEPTMMMYVFNLTDLERWNELSWEMTRNPATTSFGNREMVQKETCELAWRLAEVKYKVNSKKTEMAISKA